MAMRINMKNTFKIIFMASVSCCAIFFVNNIFANGLSEVDKAEILQKFSSAISSPRSEADSQSENLAMRIADARNPREYHDIYDEIIRASSNELRNPDVINLVIRRLPTIALQLFEIAQKGNIDNSATFVAVITALGKINNQQKLREIFSLHESRPHVFAAYIKAIGLTSFEEAAATFHKARELFGQNELMDTAFARVIANWYPDDFENVAKKYNINLDFSKPQMAKVAMHAYIQANNGFYKTKEVYAKYFKMPTNLGIVDLHGRTFPETWVTLSLLLERAYKRKETNIVIMPGKGLHSDDGSSTIKAINLFASILSNILNDEKVGIRHNEFNSGIVHIHIPFSFLSCNLAEIMEKLALVKFKFVPNEQPPWSAIVPNNMAIERSEWEIVKKPANALRVANFDGSTLLRFSTSGAALLIKKASSFSTSVSPQPRPQKQSPTSSKPSKLHASRLPKHATGSSRKKRHEEQDIDAFLEKAIQQNAAITVAPTAQKASIISEIPKQVVLSVKKAILTKDFPKLIELYERFGASDWSPTFRLAYLKATHADGVNLGNEEIKDAAVKTFVDLILSGNEISFEQLTETIVFLCQNNKWDTLINIFERLVSSTEPADVNQVIKKIFDSVLEKASYVYRFNHVESGLPIILADNGFPEYANILIKAIEKKESTVLVSQRAYLMKVYAEHGGGEAALELCNHHLNKKTCLSTHGLYYALLFCKKNRLFDHAARRIADGMVSFNVEDSVYKRLYQACVEVAQECGISDPFGDSELHVKGKLYSKLLEDIKTLKDDILKEACCEQRAMIAKMLGEDSNSSYMETTYEDLVKQSEVYGKAAIVNKNGDVIVMKGHERPDNEGMLNLMPVILPRATLKSPKEHREGNCLFDAIGEAVHKDGEELRALAVGRIRTDQDLRERIAIAAVLGDERDHLITADGPTEYYDVDNYVYWMARDRTWGTFIEAVALARELNIVIRVYIDNGTGTRTRLDITNDITAPVQPLQTIELDYINGNHFRVHQQLAIDETQLTVTTSNIHTTVQGQEDNATEAALPQNFRLLATPNAMAYLFSSGAKIL